MSTAVMLDEFIRVKDVSKMFNVNPITIKRWRANGNLPPAVKLGPKCVGWPRNVLETFLAGRVETFETETEEKP